MVAPKVIMTAVMMAANIAMTASRRIQGPRVEDLKVTVADNGTPLPDVWGTRARDGCPIIWAEDIREVERRSKTKGGKYNDYTYFGTWAVALAPHEIDGITRLWFDKHLVLDMTGTGPTTPFPIGTTERSGKGKSSELNEIRLSDHMTLYLGTETQDVDPRIRAWCEAKYGPNSATAFRGMAYIVFMDVPLEKFGNRIPQVKAEIARAVTALAPVRTVATHTEAPARLWGFTFWPDGGRFIWSDGAQYEVFDTVSLTRITSGTWGAPMALQETFGVFDNGTLLTVGGVFESEGGGQKVYMFDPDLADGMAISIGNEVLAIPELGKRQSRVAVARDSDGGQHWATMPFSVLLPFFLNGEETTFEELTGITARPCHMFTSAHGDVWIAAAALSTAGESSCHFCRIVDSGTVGGPNVVTVTGLATWSASFRDFAAVHYADDTTDRFVFHWKADGGDRIYAADTQTGAVLDTATGDLDTYNTFKQFANLRPGAASIWVNSEAGVAREVALADLSTIRSYDVVTAGPWGAIGADSVIYEPITHSLITAPQFDNELNVLPLDRIIGAETTLGAIVQDICAKGGADPAQVDTAALTQPVRGWSAARGTGKDRIEPLLDLYDSFARPHDFTLQFLPRGSTPGATIDAGEFAEAGGGSAEGSPLYSAPRAGGSDLPSSVWLGFADVDADQQPNAALSGPVDEAGSAGTTRLDMGSWSATATEARQMVARWHRRQVFERLPYEFDLSAQFLALEPGDVHPLALPNGHGATVRLESAVLGADRRIATEWVADDPSLALLDGAEGAGMDGHKPSAIPLPLPSRALAADLPLLRDADNSVNPLLYLGAAPYAAGFWPGAQMLRAEGGEFTDELLVIPADTAATWGTTTDSLADVPSPWLWDRGSSVNVVLANGGFLASSEAAVDALPQTNLLLVGQELVNFTGAVLESDGSWTLSGFKRGRRGTEWATGLHVVGETVVLVERFKVAELGLSEVGAAQQVKAVTQGRTEAGSYPVALTFTGASLKPYAPTSLAAAQAGSDWQLSWTRRTRIGGAWTGSTTIPVGETTEEYELEIMDGSDVVRTVTGLVSPAYVYSAADQTTDFGAPLGAAPSFRIYQISDAVGRGFAAVA